MKRALMVMLLVASPLLAADVSVTQPSLPVSVANGGTGTATGGITTVALATPVIASVVFDPASGSLLLGTTYYYRVAAVNCTAQNDTCTTLAATEASGSTGGSSNASMKITWGAVPGATAYNVYGRTTGAETKITASIGTTGTSYTDTGSSLSGALPTRNSTADEVHIGITSLGSVTTTNQPATCPVEGAIDFDSTLAKPVFCHSGVWASMGGGAPTGNASGDLGGTYPSPTVLSITNVTTGTLGLANGGTANTFGATPNPIYRRIGCWQPTGSGTTNVSVYGGLSSPTDVGTGASSNTVVGNTIVQPRAGTVGTNPAGFSGPYTDTVPTAKPKTYIMVYPANHCTNDTGWFGIASASITTLAVRTAASGSAASAVGFVAIGCETTVSANYMLCSGDKTNYSCKDTGLAIDGSNSGFVALIDWTTNATLSATIYPAVGAVTTTTKTSNLPANDSTLMGIQLSSKALTSQNPTVYIGGYCLEQSAL